MRFKYFTLSEFACHETGENKIEPTFVKKLDELRERCGFPIEIASGYRSPKHSIEAAKDKPGQHTTGRCADLRVSGGWMRYTIAKHAFEMGFTGIGIHQKFVHVDERPGLPVMWVY